MEASRSKIRKGILERRRERPRRRDDRPAPQIRMGFGLMMERGVRGKR